MSSKSTPSGPTHHLWARLLFSAEYHLDATPVCLRCAAGSWISTQTLRTIVGQHLEHLGRCQAG